MNRHHACEARPAHPPHVFSLPPQPAGCFTTVIRFPHRVQPKNASLLQVSRGRRRHFLVRWKTHRTAPHRLERSGKLKMGVGRLFFTRDTLSTPLGYPISAFSTVCLKNPRARAMNRTQQFCRLSWNHDNTTRRTQYLVHSVHPVPLLFAVIALLACTLNHSIFAGRDSSGSQRKLLPTLHGRANRALAPSYKTPEFIH